MSREKKENEEEKMKILKEAMNNFLASMKSVDGSERAPAQPIQKRAKLYYNAALAKDAMQDYTGAIEFYEQSI
jgi:tetratricopeptide (TPR) repeat protein